MEDIGAPSSQAKCESVLDSTTETSPPPELAQKSGSAVGVDLDAISQTVPRSNTQRSSWAKDSESDSSDAAEKTRHGLTRTASPLDFASDLELVEPSYRKYITTLATTKYPSLTTVSDFINEQPIDPADCSATCLLCAGFRPCLITVTKITVQTVFTVHTHENGAWTRNIKSLMGAIHQQSLQPSVRDHRLVLMIEDLQPRGLTALGGCLGMDPRIFERYLSHHREFTTSLSGVDVVDYVQGYFVRKSNGSMLKEGEYVLDELPSLNSRRSKLKRFWRDVAGHEQRVVVATIPNPRWQVPIDVILFASRPKEKYLSVPEFYCRLSPCEPVADLPSFSEYLSNPYEVITFTQTKSRGNMQLIQDSLAVRKDQLLASDNLAARAAIDFGCRRWQDIIDHIQEAISESNTPDYTNLRLVRSIMRRRQVLTETRRTLSTMKDTISRISTDSAKRFDRFEDRMRAWVEDLDGLLSTISNYIALDEADRAIRHARRSQQLTVLAFVFIPITAVATAFGMNVDVLGENPSITWFVVVTAITTLVTFAYAAWYSQLNLVGKLSVLNLGSLVLDVVVLVPRLVSGVFWAIMMVLLAIPFAFYVPFIFLVYIPCVLVFCDEPGFIFPEGKWGELGFDSMKIFCNVVIFCWNMTVISFTWTARWIEPRKYWRRNKRLPTPGKGGYWSTGSTPDPGADCIVM